MNLNKNKNSYIEMLLLTALKELKQQVHYEMEEALTTKISTMEENKTEELLSIKEATEYLGVSKITLWKLRKSGEIKTHVLGSQVYFKKSEILKSLVRVN